MRVDLVTREYPPAVYGGAGVHVTELVKAMRRDIDVNVRCFGDARDEQQTYAYTTPPALREHPDGCRPFEPLRAERRPQALGEAASRLRDSHRNGDAGTAVLRFGAVDQRPRDGEGHIVHSARRCSSTSRVRSRIRSASPVLARATHRIAAAPSAG